MMFLSHLVPPAGVNSRTPLSLSPALGTAPAAQHPHRAVSLLWGQGCKVQMSHSSFPASLLYVSGCNVGFSCASALPGCRDWGHFGGGHCRTPALAATTPPSAAAPQAKDVILGRVFLMSVKFPWLLSRSITCHIPMIYSLHFPAAFFHS